MARRKVEILHEEIVGHDSFEIKRKKLHTQARINLIIEYEGTLYEIDEIVKLRLPKSKETRVEYDHRIKLGRSDNYPGLAYFT